MRLKAKDILITNSEIFEKGDKATPIGWLHRYCLGSKEIRKEEMDKLAKAKKILCKIVKVREPLDLLDWEDKVKPGKAAIALNKCFKELDK